MRDPKRIRKFCNELADLWESKCPDLRFGQIMAYAESLVEGEVSESLYRYGDTFSRM